MTLLDECIYYTCCFIVILHSLSALLVVTHGRCSVYAAAFVIASAMWLGLTVLNLWFFLPPILQDASLISLNFTGDIIGDTVTIAREVLVSSSASYLYMMTFGWFVGSMSLSNALTMWQREGCEAMDAHRHSGLAAWVVRLAYRVEECVGIEDSSQLVFWSDGEAVEPSTSRKSFIFALPRRLHPYYLEMLSPQIRLLGSRREGVALAAEKPGQ